MAVRTCWEFLEKLVANTGKARTMDIHDIIEKFKPTVLGPEAEEELNNGRGEDELFEADEQVPTDPTA